MNHVACQNKRCPLKGFPYTVDEDEEKLPSCSSCRKRMALIEEPAAADEDDPTVGSVLEIDPEDFAPLDVRRDRAMLGIRNALADSDMWAIRHIEDGESLTPERIAYRQQLRQLFAEAEASDNPDKIELPDKPT